MIKKYLTLQFLLATGLIYYSRLDKVLLVFNGALFVLGLVFSFVSSMKKRDNPAFAKLLAKWAALLITMGALALLWSLFREQAIVLLSAHVVLLAIYIGMLIWLYYVLRYQFTVHKNLAEEQRKLAERQKYLPK